MSFRYCDNVISKELNSALLELLAELHRFQDRLYHKDPVKVPHFVNPASVPIPFGAQARLKRRFVCGLREVGKVVGLGKAKLVVLAPNLNAFACLDDKMKSTLPLYTSSLLLSLGLLRGA